MEILLVRHGLPQRVELDNGAADPALSSEGHSQATAVCAWLEGQSIDAVYSSPLRRAIQTAEPLVEGKSIDLAISPDVAEFDRDSSTYIPLEELKAQDYAAWKAFVDGGYGEDADIRAFSATVVRGLERIIADHGGQRVAVFCHGGVVNMWTSHVLAMPPRLFVEPRYASVSRYLCASSGERSVVSLNETQHLTP